VPFAPATGYSGQHKRARPDSQWLDKAGAGLISSGGETGNIDQIHLTLVLVHGIDATLARIRAPAGMQIATVEFSKIGGGVKTANIIALTVFNIVQN
jgi:hypothetical protein